MCGVRESKGHFKTGDSIYCYPLTVADGFSRFLLGCQALQSTCVAQAKPVFTRLFKEYGLPKRIRTDNGVPFATVSLARLSQLSAWWVRLGVLPSSSTRASRSKMAVTSACIARSKPRPLDPRLTVPAGSNDSSIAFVRSSTSSARTKHSTCKPQPRYTRARRVRCRTSCRR
jgi:hypothetical protein